MSQVSDLNAKLLKCEREKDQLRTSIAALWNVLAKNDRLFHEACRALEELAK